MKYLIVGTIAAILLFLIWQMLTMDKKNRNRTLSRLKSQWGKIPERAYESEELDSLIRSYEKKMAARVKKSGKTEYFVDDITWNDLNMNAIFSILNNTQSSLGDEYVYDALRRPFTDGEILKKREELITYFGSNEEKRIEMQLLLAKLGRMKRYTPSEYLDTFLTLHTTPMYVHIIPLVLMAVCIVIFPFYLPIIWAFLILIVYNVIMYYREKGKIEPYFACVRYISAMVEICRELDEKFGDCEEIKWLTQDEKECLKVLKNVTKGNVWLGNFSSSDNPVELGMEYVRIITHMDLIVFTGKCNIIQGGTEEIREIMKLFGELELALAVASFREHFKALCCIPEFDSEGKIGLDTLNVYHPLVENPVANTIKEERCVLLTGSNASGKSTFLKTIAINAILAQTIHTVLATYWKAPYYRIYSSMALRDDLEKEESYYMAEIRSLKRIMDAAKMNSESADTNAPILCFVDEVLRGTNTIERIAASSQILSELSTMNIMCFAATHDIELTYILENEFSNYHFREEMEEETDEEGNVVVSDLTFHYILYSGRSTTRNAIRLLNLVGYERDLTKKAEERALFFENTGKWT